MPWLWDANRFPGPRSAGLRTGFRRMGPRQSAEQERLRLAVASLVGGALVSAVVILVAILA